MRLLFDGQFFNPRDTLECGQIFRFKPFKKGYLVLSLDKACYLYSQGSEVIAECEDGEYFRGFFDADRDYSSIVSRAISHNIPYLSRAAKMGRGIRLLNQDPAETIISFIISQNNNIPRIKSIIEKICARLGEKREFLGESYYTFPSCSRLAKMPPEFYRALGAGYRDAYIAHTAARIEKEGLENLTSLDGAALKKALETFEGIGPKVADCVALFAFKKTGNFPVDTWMEKVYFEEFGGGERGERLSREKISQYFCALFGEDAGFFQQYMFYLKRGS